MTKDDKLWYDFAGCISQIRSPELFLGVARILKVNLMADSAADTPRDFGEIYEDVMIAFEAASRKRKKELIKILREANKA